ncbi:MAG: polymerase subunit epsilon [Hyphomicrobiales bacterium]|nr:polymerase subunit epsilon [Hyphomicrobiales bacterium]
MREIILDTETTGLDPSTGDRLVEIACVETINTIPTGENYHVYIDPQRDMPEEAFRIHGLSIEFLKGMPLFDQVGDEFLQFIGDSPLVIHNAEFDMRFINAELQRCNRPPLEMKRVIDTLPMARRKHPGAQNSLDALCSRYRIDNSRRTKHGALLDAELLAEVYVELLGGRQVTLILASEIKVAQKIEVVAVSARAEPLPTLTDANEFEAHRNFVAAMGAKAIWGKYLPL